MCQVHTVEQAVRAAEAGAAIVIAQGAEAGRFGGEISTMALVPQVVDAIAPVPVLAAGGIADGPGLAAALVLGAQGVNIGTRFLAAAVAGVRAGRAHELVPFGGQTAGLIDRVLPAREVVAGMVRDATARLAPFPGRRPG